MPAIPLERPEHLLVVSDLHLGPGRSPATGRFSRREDFFFDEEFARFLAYHAEAARAGRYRWHLVIAGDFLEFLQVVSTAGAPEGLPRDRDMESYGLGAGERESVFKLEQIVAGHPLFFNALAAFVAGGNLLTVMKGNHDVELHYPRVQAALLRVLRARALAPIGEDAIRFTDWFFHEPGILWIEHGCQYDAQNAFRYQLSPLMPARPDWPEDRRNDIDLPFGSMFVRYLFNALEDVEPDADNVKPTTAFVAWLFRNHPLTALRFAFGGKGRHFLSKLGRAWKAVPDEAYDERRQVHDAALARLARDSGIAEATLRELDAPPNRERSVFEAPRGPWKLVRALVSSPNLALALLAVLIVPILLALEIARLLSGGGGDDPGDLPARARRIAERVGVRYVVMGHTHDPDLRSLGAGGREYFNTGTWTKVFDENGRLLRPDTQLTFLQGERKADGGLRMRLMEWHDAAGEPRLLKLFGSAAPAPPDEGGEREDARPIAAR